MCLNCIRLWKIPDFTFPILTGITGKGVTVAVIDDGMEWRHDELRRNYVGFFFGGGGGGRGARC